MSEEKSFKYTAENPVFVTQSPKEIKILNVKNLIPIEITYEADGTEQKIVAAVDYSSNELSGISGLAEESRKELSDKFFNFIYKKMILPSDLFAEESPTVSEIPKEEDVQW